MTQKPISIRYKPVSRGQAWIALEPDEIERFTKDQIEHLALASAGLGVVLDPGDLAHWEFAKEVARERRDRPEPVHEPDPLIAALFPLDGLKEQR